MAFDGQSYLSIKHYADITFDAGSDYTVSAWVYLGDAVGSGWRGIVTKSRDKSPWYGLWLDGGGNYVFGGSGENLSGGQIQKGWHHICGVQTGNESRVIYVDGRLAGKGRALTANGGGDLWIGGAKSVKEFFTGALGEVRIYRRALSHPEVAHLAKN